MVTNAAATLNLMLAITVPTPGGPEALVLAEVPDPTLAPDEVLLDVVAAGVNRADLLQRQGHYPPPPGASAYLGLECSGRVAAVGADVTGWAVGDEACALLAGGGYAARVAVPAAQLLPVPTGVPLVASGAVRPIVHARMPLAQAADAHRLLESSTHIGKVLLTA